MSSKRKKIKLFDFPIEQIRSFMATKLLERELMRLKKKGVKEVVIKL